MHLPRPRAALLTSFLVALALGTAALTSAQTLTVTGTQPALHALAAPASGVIALSFDRALDPATVPPIGAHVKVFGKHTGVPAGTFSLANGDRELRFTPAVPFAAGEDVVVSVSHDVRAADGAPLALGGYTLMFRVAVAQAGFEFVELQELSTSSPTSPNTRIYGAQGCDANEDGALDLCVVSENTSDIRVFLNHNDGHGTFADFLTPPNQVGLTPSPNENADFDGDGFIDIATANYGSGSVSVLLGNGDGTFRAAQHYPVGGWPAGMAVLDVDGDGDTDIACGSLQGNHVALLRNDGSGSFGAATTFDGGQGEYGLAAADFDNDGIMDLVVGASWTGQLRVHLGDGLGGFALSGSAPSGGVGWMLACGDVNGDGNVDVTSANGGTSNASVLLGDGQGHLAPAVVHPTPGHTTATDLGDLDGDGDLDWVVSIFGAGVWEVRENDGQGNFALRTVYPANANPACATVLDVDGDRDLDLVLLDEIANTITVMENAAPAQALCLGETGCPCLNDAPVGSGTGCVNVTGVGGRLRSTGSGSVALDDLRLEATQLPTQTFGILFMGSATVPATTMGGGLRCAGGALFRYGAHSTGAGGAHTEGPGIVLGTHAFGAPGTIDAGETWVFQYWYRSNSGACATSNVTNALAVTFQP